jgi:hypothetical protein
MKCGRTVTKDKKKGVSRINGLPLFNQETKNVLDHILLTFAAAGPLGPSVISN